MAAVQRVGSCVVCLLCLSFPQLTTAQGILDSRELDAEELLLGFVVAAQDCSKERAVVFRGSAWSFDRLADDHPEQDLVVIDYRERGSRFWASGRISADQVGVQRRMWDQRLVFSESIAHRFGFANESDACVVGKKTDVEFLKRGPLFNPYYAAVAPYYSLAGKKEVDDDFGLRFFVSNGAFLGQGRTASGNLYGVWHILSKQPRTVEMVFSKTPPHRPMSVTWRFATTKTEFSNYQDSAKFSSTVSEWKKLSFRDIQVPVALEVQALDKNGNGESGLRAILEWKSVTDFPVKETDAELKELMSLTSDWKMPFLKLLEIDLRESFAEASKRQRAQRDRVSR